MNRGYIAIWRKIKGHPFAKEKRVFSKYEAWLDILMEAQYSLEPQEVVFGMKTMTCNYGECLKSTRTWGRRWDWSESKVRRFLALLKKLNQIHFMNEIQTTRITVLNYKQYDPRLTHGRRTVDARSTTDNKVKKEKKEKTSAIAEEMQEVYITKKGKQLTNKRLSTFLQFWDSFGYKKGKAESADAWLSIPMLTDSLVDQICSAAKIENDNREELKVNGKTPKMAEGWLSGRRWEDEEYQKSSASGETPEEIRERLGLEA